MIADKIIIYQAQDKDPGRTEHDCPKCHTNIQPIPRKGGKYLCPECMHKAEVEAWYV